jgi:hypothetical protein
VASLPGLFHLFNTLQLRASYELVQETKGEVEQDTLNVEVYLRHESDGEH